jgi:hypothetical protein
MTVAPGGSSRDPADGTAGSGPASSVRMPMSGRVGAGVVAIAFADMRDPVALAEDVFAGRSGVLATGSGFGGVGIRNWKG